MMADKMTSCRICGGAIAKSAKRCPHCGARNKKVFSQKWWFWAVVVLLIVVIANAESNGAKTIPRTASDKATVAVKSVEDKTDTPVERTEPSISAAEETDNQLVDGMRPEFKEALDSCDAFFDEYCEFMEKYAENPTDLNLVSDYATFMTQYAETMTKMEALDDGEMNDEETLYYAEVTARITQNLLETTASID